MPAAAVPSVVRSSVSGISETSNQSSSSAGDREADPGDRDRAVLDQVALEAVGDADPHAPGEAVVGHRERPRRRASTWPWTMWPPSGSPARSAGSRLTGSPGVELAEGGQRQSVWFMTSASKPSARRRVAVRQAPETATESPSASSAAKLGVDPSRAPAVAATRSLATVPTLLDDPGEHHHSRSRARASMSSPLRSQSTASGRGAVGDAGRRRRRPPAAGPAPSSIGAMNSAQLVDLARRQQRAGELGAALDQQRGDRRGGRARRARRGAGRSRSPASSITSAPASRSAATPVGVGVGGDDDVERRLVERARRAPSRAGRRAGESKTTRAGWRAESGRRRRGRSAAGRRRARCRSRPRPRRPRRASGARGRGSPARRSTSSRRPRVAVKPSRLIADFRVTSGRPVRACLRNGWTSSRAAAASAPSAKLDLDAARRAGSRGRGRTPSRSGRRSRSTTRAMPAARIASVHGGWRPWWAHGSSET